MPDPFPLDFQEKRRLLHARGQDSARRAAADALVAAGRLAESLEYLERTKDEVPLRRVRVDAIRAGDAFTLSRACQILRVEAEPSEWRELSENAGRAGKWYDAVVALERAGDQEKADALRVERCPDFRPFKPSGK